MAAKPAPRAGARPAQAAEKENEKKVVISPIGRACFVHVWEPFAFPPAPGKPPNDPAYSLILVFEKKKLDVDPAWKALRQGVTNALRAKFGTQLDSLVKRGKIALPWRDAEDYEQYGPPFEAGNKFITLKSRNAPGVVNERSGPILRQDDFYPGCYARASCLPWAFDTAGNQGCTLLLNNVQKAAEGERLAGGRANAEDEFEPLAEGGRDDDGDGGDLLG